MTQAGTRGPARIWTALMATVTLSSGILIGAPALGQGGYSWAQTVVEAPAAGLATLYFGTKEGSEEQWRQFIGGDVEEVWAHSPSMNRDIPLVVLRADNSAGPRPTVYLLNGADGGEGTANWLWHSDALSFFRSKNVNLVIPMQGYRSFYTDWVEDNPKMGGTQKWETFMTSELPGAIENALGASGKRAIIGNSMSATTVVLYAEHHPGLYNAIASLSGCQQTNGFLGELTTTMVIASHGTKTMMWGPMDGATWAYNDVFAHIDSLRGQTMYIANGSGTFGPYDLPGSPFLWDGVTSGDSIFNGGVIEMITNICAHNFQAKLNQAGIPATFNFSPIGTHSWGYWQDYLHDSWRVIGPAIEG